MLLLASRVNVTVASVVTPSSFRSVNIWVDGTYVNLPSLCDSNVANDVSALIAVTVDADAFPTKLPAVPAAYAPGNATPHGSTNAVIRFAFAPNVPAVLYVVKVAPHTSEPIVAAVVCPFPVAIAVPLLLADVSVDEIFVLSIVATIPISPFVPVMVEPVLLTVSGI